MVTIKEKFLELQEEEHFGHEVAVPTGPFNVVEQESISLEDKLKRVEEIERVQRQI